MSLPSVPDGAVRLREKYRVMKTRRSPMPPAASPLRPAARMGAAHLAAAPRPLSPRRPAIYEIGRVQAGCALPVGCRRPDDQWALLPDEPLDVLLQNFLPTTIEVADNDNIRVEAMRHGVAFKRKGDRDSYLELHRVEAVPVIEIPATATPCVVVKNGAIPDMESAPESVHHHPV